MNLKFDSFFSNDSSYTKEILNMLQILGISQESIQCIMDEICKMPNSTHVQGAWAFLTELTAKKSIREEYYQYSNYISEFFCAFSNLGLFAVAYYYNDYATLFAATFSALSHAIPSQRLHDMDILGVVGIFAKAIMNYDIVLERPEIMAWGLGALSINLLDTLLTRKYLDKIGPSIHVAWHMAAAFALYKFNKAQVEVTQERLELALNNSTQQVPEFLEKDFNLFKEHMDHFYNFSAQSSCTIL